MAFLELAPSGKFSPFKFDPEKALRTPIGAASPLWLAFAGAVGVGVAFWGVARFLRGPEPKAPAALPPPVEPVAEPEPVVEMLSEPEPVVSEPIVAEPVVAEPVVEAPVEVAVEPAVVEAAPVAPEPFAPEPLTPEPVAEPIVKAVEETKPAPFAKPKAAPKKATTARAAASRKTAD